MGKKIYDNIIEVPKEPCIYKMYFSDGSTYVGRTKNFRKRLSNYMSNARRGKNDSRVFGKMRNI